MAKIKQNDKVIVMRGKAAGQTGTVLRVIKEELPSGTFKMRILVDGINKVKRHVKPNKLLNLPGGIVEVERPIDASNVMLLDPKSGKPTRIGYSVDAKTGKKTRVAKKSGQAI